MIPALQVPLGRPRVMGVVNVTPDSFSDGGRCADTADAVAHGLALLAQGADLLDIGGESTRPGATRPLVAEELGRVVPVIRELGGAGAVVSVDTMRAEVAGAALEAGAVVVNDVSGGLADPAILGVVADAGATYVAMHWRAHSDRMRDFAVYDETGGVVAAVCRELAERLEAAGPPAWPTTGSCSTPGWASPRPPRTTGSCCATWTRCSPSATRCWWARAASRSSARCWPTPAGPGRWGSARPPTWLVVLELARAGVWGVRVHDVRSARDALAARAAMSDTTPTQEGRG